MRVVVIGGTGFVGRYLIDALLEHGHEVTLFVRPGSAAKLARAGRCRIVEGELDSVTALKDSFEGGDAVIYCIGILREIPRRGITFENCQYRGVVRAIDEAARAGVRRFLLMSANGVKQPGTPYQETKYRAERVLEDSGLDFTIFRPSVIFGNPRGAMEIATQLHRDMVRPPLPAVGFHTGWNPGTGPVLMSPVHVHDVADAFAAALADSQTIGHTYVLVGPEILSWTEMLRRIAAAVGKRKQILPMPIPVMRFAATLLDWLPFFPVTRDQLTMLAEGNTGDPQSLQQLIDREPMPFSEANLSYLRN